MAVLEFVFLPQHSIFILLPDVLTLAVSDGPRLPLSIINLGAQRTVVISRGGKYKIIGTTLLGQSEAPTRER